jgi:catechol 2,3-dioxygenase-like lactoylglutathione lyase family enzyme
LRDSAGRGRWRRNDTGFRIELLRYREPPGEAAAATRRLTTQGLRHFAVRVDDLDDCLARARGLGFAVGVEPVQVPFSILASGKRMAYFQDPDGVVVELAEYGRDSARLQHSAVIC